ncbi:bifunctional UDP-N-acetylmuramoyl-tripeptide:D-alanyl-D-alanine ligase/alanine racemase [Myroides indicus]|uniref:Alanine racemase n=1 Tax=Myroides indicus TaxID=1323422 RepID=A0A4R7EVP8_9FLAO|nr:bifunctional UDP-N-acetylmuramoyl-tripeptide:D-alanyl-D-alanine ligase/alanine racemase [Myroides indicus]TDS55933.1 UDP-N-acetylmuramoyl-tripeptide--D-alanyl-D-alanine ligase [Myroides indicus]
MKFNSGEFIAFLDATTSCQESETIEIAHVSVDSRSLLNDNKTLFFALKGKNHNGHDYIGELIDKGVKYFVVSDHEEWRSQYKTGCFFKVKNTLHALQRSAAFHRLKFDFPVIGITGSKGKTVVKEWLNFLMSEEYRIIKSPKSYNSQTGVPLSVFGIEEKHNLGIFEAGISTQNEMKKLAEIIKPTMGILTAITDEHQEGFDSIDQKIQEKIKLFENATVVFCENDKRITKHIFDKELFTWSFSDSTATVFAKIQGKNLHLIYNGREIEVKVPFDDSMSINNIVICICVLLYLKYPDEIIQQRIMKLYPIEMRLQVKKGVNRCVIIDDAYNADYQSIIIALDFLEKHKTNHAKTIVLSDVFRSDYKETEVYEQIRVLLERHKLTKIIAIGENIGKYLSGLNNMLFFKNTDTFLQKMSIDDFNDETILVKGARSFRFDKIVSLLEEKTHETVLEVDLTAIRHNLNFYRSMLKPETKIMVMVKAFGYGNGSVEIAKLLAHENVNYLGVAFADEGITLRKSGIKTPVIVMNPEFSAFEAMIAYDLEPEIYSVRELNIFLKVAREKNCYNYPVHIKLDTGMHRHGFLVEDLKELVEILKYTNVVEVKSIFSHLSSSDLAEHIGFTLNQIENFQENVCLLTNELAINPIKHILNTSGIFNFPQYQFDMVRLGIGLYGVGNGTEETKCLKNVSTLKTRVMQVKEIAEGQSVGYGRRFKTQRITKIATVPIGYADGIHRSWGNEKGYVIINKQKAMIIGSICMDMLMVDVTDMCCEEGDEVIVFGEELPVVEISSKLNTIPYEILTSISQRVKRIFYEE